MKPLLRIALIAAGLLLPGAALAESRTYDLPDFDGVSVSAGIVAIVTVGEAQSVIAEAPSEAVLNRLEVDVRGGRLSLGIDSNMLDWLFNLGRQRDIVVRVSAPALKTGDASSGADLDIKGMAGDRLSLSASSGASVAASGITGGDVTIDVSSGASMSAAGNCTTLSANASTGANLDADNLVCPGVTANASTGAQMSVSASSSLSADASTGAGISVSGKPGRTEVNSSTGGSITFAP